MAGDNSPSQTGGWRAEPGHGDQAPFAASRRRAGGPAPDPESDIRLTVPARPENVAVVRHVLDALAQALDLSPALIHDLRLAVTEACTNVVRHAYDHADGTIDVTMRPLGDTLELVVSDAGRGIGPSPDTAGPGLGLPLIAALSDTLEIESDGRVGSRLTMSFLRTRFAPAMGLA